MSTLIYQCRKRWHTHPWFSVEQPRVVSRPTFSSLVYQIWHFSKARLCAHVQIFSSKFSYEVFLQYTILEWILWGARETLNCMHGHVVSFNQIYGIITQDYSYAIMSAMASQITRLTIVYSTVYSGADQRKHQSSASLAFVRGIHRRPVNSPHKGPVTRKRFPFDDVIMKPCASGW